MHGALLAATYVVAYLAFSLPAIAAGIGVAHSDLRSTTYRPDDRVERAVGAHTAAAPRSNVRQLERRPSPPLEMLDCLAATRSW